MLGLCLLEMVNYNEVYNMRDPERIDVVLEEIAMYWKENPDLRLGQIIVNMNNNQDPFYMEDDALLERLKSEILTEKGGGYVVVINGNGEGCDHTIGCNVVVQYIENLPDNEKHIEQLIDHYVLILYKRHLKNKVISPFAVSSFI